MASTPHWRTSLYRLSLPARQHRLSNGGRLVYTKSCKKSGRASEGVPLCVVGSYCVRGVHHQSIFLAIVQEFTNTIAIDSDMCTIIHALTYMGTCQPDQPISRASLPSMSVSMVLSPIDHRAVAASPLQVTTLPPFYFVHATWLQNTSLVVCSRCTNLRQSSLPPVRVVSLLQAANFLVQENRCPRLSPHLLPCKSRHRPSMIDIMPPGSSLPNSSVISVLKETYHRCNNKLYYSLFVGS
jgi:hypothetical protein